MDFLTPKFLKQQGIVDWGYTEQLEAQSYQHYEDWVKAKKHLPLTYLEGERQSKRKSLTEYFPSCQSALVFLFSYQRQKKWLDQNPWDNGLKLASYALAFEGSDYHLYLREKLTSLRQLLQQKRPDLEVRFTLDTQPVLERDLAYRAGLGWFGKNSLLIHREQGSFFLLGSLLLSQKISELTPQIPEVDHCGQCRACLDACPTGAIEEDERTIISEKCISTYTIELFKPAPAPEGYEQADGFIFGCDICQDVCPWNEKALERLQPLEPQGEKVSLIMAFFKRPISMIKAELTSMSKRGFKKFFQGTALERTGRDGFLKNLKALPADLLSKTPLIQADDEAGDEVA